MTQADAVPTPFPTEGLATLTPSSICLRHNIRDGSDVPVPGISGEDHQDFIDSIEAQGILVRCTVKLGPCEHGKPYVCIAGHRRVTGEAITRGMDEGQVPVEIIDQERELDIITMLVENLQRTGLNPLEEARGYAELIREHSWSQADVARSVGKSAGHVSERIALLGLPEKAKTMITDGKLPLRAALKLTKVPVAIAEAALANPGPKTEDMIEYDIRAATRKAEMKGLIEARKAQLEKAGATVASKPPAGGSRLLLKDERNTGYGERPLKLSLTPKQFYKEPGAVVVVKAPQSAYDKEPVVQHWTTQLSRYTQGEATDKVEAAPADQDEGHDPAAVEAVLAHRREFLRELTKAKTANADILIALTPVLWRSLVERNAAELAEALGLFAEGEDTDDWRLAQARLEQHIAGKKIGDQLRLCYLARYATDLNKGLGRWDNSGVPQSFLDAGYVPTEVEAEWLDAIRQELHTEWERYREMIATEYVDTAETGEMDTFLDACSASEAEGDGPDDFEHPLLSVWDDREQAAEIDDDDDEGEPEMTGAEAIGEEHAGE